MKTESRVTSCDVQRDICVRFAEGPRKDSPPLKILDERFDDEGRTGANSERPALQRMLGLIRAGTIKAVMVHRIDRLSRRVLDCASLLDEFKKYGVRLFVAAMPEIASGAHDTLMLNVMAAFAEFERDMTADRIRDTRAGLVARGWRIAGMVSYGYGADARTRQWAPIPDQAAIVRQLFELVGQGIVPSEVA